MPLNILILGVNGFIGSNLIEAILKHRDWNVFGMDLMNDKILHILNNPRFHFKEGDITINKEWVEYHIKKCDVVLPLVAIANPSVYVKEPLRVFELDFEANLPIIRKCVAYKKRLIFPSTSEVYGMSPDTTFEEETTNFVLGPIQKQRWIYSCCKQLLDRVIYAYGFQENLNYTLFRPFNWIGPKLDSITNIKEGSSRVVSQFIGRIFQGQDIQLVDGGLQRRSFTYIDDAIEGLLKIIDNKDNCTRHQIFNLGNPNNDASIKDLAQLLLDLVKTYPSHRLIAEKVKIVGIDSSKYYGSSYQDTNTRVPCIEKANKILGWHPVTDLKTALKKTLDYYIKAV